MNDVAVERLVPHRPPMLLVTDVRQASEDEITCVGRIGSGHPLAGEHGAPAVLGVELIAQSAACHEGLRLRGHVADDDHGESTAAVHGYLVSISRSRFRVALLPVDEDLLARVRLVRTMGALASYAGFVCRAARSRRPLVTCRFLVRGPKTD